MTQEFQRKVLEISAVLEGDASDQQTIAKAGIDVLALVLAKNRDYGSSAWKRPVLLPHLDPMTAMLVRLSDKIERLSNLLGGGGRSVSDESTLDTIRDINGYSLLILALAEKNGGVLQTGAQGSTEELGVSDCPAEACVKGPWPP